MLKKLYVKMRQQLRDGSKSNTGKEKWLKEKLPQASLMQMLEPRLMFDGAAIETVNISDDVSSEEQNYILNAIDENEQAKATATLLNAIEKGAENLQIDYSQFKEVVIIDARVEDPHVLIQNISREAAVEVVSSSKDGVDAIADILQKYQNLDAVHIISHGDQGELHLGNTDLNLSNIDNYEMQLAQWGQALSQSGDILFYGCNVAEGEAGQSFIDQLKTYTDADIAASTDATGYSTSNADADLEIKQNVNVSEIVNFNQYQHVLDANVDPTISELLELKDVASDGAASDYLGHAAKISADGSTMVVGAYGDDDNGGSSGSVYIYSWDGSNWSNEEKLTASDGAVNDYFGYAVDISEDGNTIIVGAYGDDDKGSNAGSSYIYKRDNSSSPWVESKILAIGGVASDQFGFSVAMSGDGNTAVISSRLDDDGGIDSGSVYVYQYNGVSWQFLTKQVSSDDVAYDYFGESVALSYDGSTIVVGAYGDDDEGSASGSVYIYNWDESSSEFTETKLTAGDGAADDHFGASVAVAADGRTIVVGSRYDDDQGTNSGAAYIYDFNGIAWTQTQKLTASNAAASDYFGGAVTISANGKNIVVGAYANDSAAGTDTGGAYLYKYDGDTWQEFKVLQASDIAASDHFGYAVSLNEDGSRIVIGSRYDDDSGADSGSVYTYVINDIATLDPLTVDEGHDPINITGNNPDIFTTDTTNFNGGHLLLVSSSLAEDNFSIENQGTGAGQISVSGSDVAYEGNVIGVVDGTLNGLLGNNLRLNFTTDDASFESLSAFIHAIQYQNTALTPQASRNISLTITDPEDGVSNTVAQTINVVAVDNVVPVIGELSELKLIASDGAANDYFGESIQVSADGSTLVVGAYADDDNGSSSGSIYVYAWDGSNWIGEEKLTPLDGAASDNFGISVSIAADGNTIIVGANGDDDNGGASGSAYIYTRADNVSPWSEVKISAFDGAASDEFGFSVAMSGDGNTVAMGARYDDDKGSNSGSVYVYRFNGTTWDLLTKQTASDGVASDYFGEPVALSYDGNTFIVGTHFDDDNGGDSGSAYIYSWDALAA